MPTRLGLEFPGAEGDETMSDLDVFNQIVQQPQRQDSLLDQLADLIDVANLLGMYDAADYVSRTIYERNLM